ncbi:sugar phosphate isomerase/epimerase family protein [Paenibacillus harenae]|uniref:sugar phosphate isomerase/epimerase family protein n=1 Tax=Paenibacillus harenae TaxID=306543 RepID=UPI00041C569F|nr:sugar phosphate isomerase/epimerase family protein [Paenibacillus harenae]
MIFPFKLSLNSSTLFPYKLGVEEQIAIAAEAGYAGIELWVRDIDAYLEGGGKLAELRRRVESSGIAVVNAIAFWSWADSDAAARSKGFEHAKRELELLAELGCAAAAAPPFGSVASVSLDDMAEQFAKLAELSRGIGVEPYLEFWGRASKLNRLSEAVYVAMQSGVADAKLLLDPFHMYTGGSDFEGIGFLNGDRIGIVHVNDYPAEPACAVIADKDRVFPGDGIAPSSRIAQLLHASGYGGFLSLELFIEDFGSRSALEIAKQGLEKAKAAFSVHTAG